MYPVLFLDRSQGDARTLPYLQNGMHKVSLNNIGTYTQWTDRIWETFSNGGLSVHFVLAYEQGNPEHAEKRKRFEENLQNTGLILERDESQRIHFVKLHVPLEIASQYADILKLRLPIKDNDEQLPKDSIFTSVVKKCLKKYNATLNPEKFPVKKYELNAEFSKDKTYLFDIDAPDFFNTSVKIAIASYILEREKFGPEDQNLGIKQLIAEEVYKAAYPLHEGNCSEPGSKRHLLFHEWASVSKWRKTQPIDEIKDYFGVKWALYFTWLGFYTYMLIPAAIVGVISFTYGVSTLGSDSLSQDICKLDIDMCPLDDKNSTYWKLAETCTYSRIQHVIDNPATILFTVFMSIWGVLYLELWKRYSAEIAHRWGLTGLDLQAEHPRPEFLLRLANAKRKKLNVITQLEEPVVPFWRVKLPSIVLSFTIAIFWVLMILAVLIAIVIYKKSLSTSGSIYNGSPFGDYIVTLTANLLNAVGIFILNRIYDKLVVWLTEMELQRTQTEFDDSLALKMYISQSVNYYSSIFYIAFIKGKFVGYPAEYNKIFGYRQEECNPGGCLMELTMQLGSIMVTDKLLSIVQDELTPLCVNQFKRFLVAIGIKKDKDKDLISCNQWTEDYKLSNLESQSLFTEYLQMVFQYGFVTIFVAAFPLAPLLALINNIFEMRLDARKLIKYHRRPVPQRVRNIGIWYAILAFTGRIAVVSNSMIIAFSSNFIPKLVYMLSVSGNYTTEGFLQFSLSHFNASDFPNGTYTTKIYWIKQCRYSDYRNPPDRELKYERPLIFWHILAARLAFVIVYQHLVSFIMAVVEWAIPDVSGKLNERILREAYKVNEIIIKNEAEKTKKKRVRRRKSNNAWNQRVPGRY